MTQLKYAIDYSVALAETIEDIDYDEIEDSHSGMLLSSKGSSKYENQQIYCGNLSMNYEKPRNEIYLVLFIRIFWKRTAGIGFSYI